MTHHVIEHTAALQRALPEPRHMRAAVLLGGACEVRTASQSCAAGPDKLAPASDVRREQLVLEVPGVEAHTLHQINHFLRFGDVSRERLFAGEAAKRSCPAFNGVDDLL